MTTGSILDSRWRAPLKVAAIAAAVWFAFSPVLAGGWLWDDAGEITHNAVLRDPHGLEKIWRGEVGPDYFPLKTSVQWIEWHLWGDRALGYHATSLGLHLMGALLLWRVLLKLGLRTGAWLGGLLFAVHPLVVESVAWISELKNVLSLPLLLLAMGAWIDFDRGGKTRDYALSFLWFAAAAMAKTSVVMFPVILLLHAWWRRGRVSGRDLAASAPFFALSLALGIVTIRFQEHRVMDFLPMPVESAAARIAGAGLAAAFYLWKSVAPVGLVPIYPRWPLNPPEPWQYVPWIAFPALLAWFWSRRGTWGRHALFGFGSFLVNLAPVSGILPMAFLRISRVSDHLAYLPLVSLVALAAAGFEAWRTAARPAIAWSAAALLIAGCIGLSRQYAAKFVSEERLWTYTLRLNPGAWLAHNNLGIVLAESGHLDEAIFQGREAVRLRPDLAESHSNLGLALTDAGRQPEAVLEFREALRLNPRMAGVHLNLGRALAKAGEPEASIPEFEEALRLQPGYPEAIQDLAVAQNNLANTLARAGRLTEAIAHFREAIRLNPANAGTHRNLGFALHALGRDADALGQFEEADRLEGKQR